MHWKTDSAFYCSNASNLKKPERVYRIYRMTTFIHIVFIAIPLTSFISAASLPVRDLKIESKTPKNVDFNCEATINSTVINDCAVSIVQTFSGLVRGFIQTDEATGNDVNVFLGVS